MSSVQPLQPSERGVCLAKLRPVGRSHGPYTGQREAAAEFGTESLILGENLIKEVLSVPEAYGEVTGPRLGSGRALEASPCDQEALIGVEVSHCAAQLAELLDADLPGFNLHCQAGCIHTERADASEDIDTPIRARRTLANAGEPLGSKHFRDEIRQAVSGKPFG